MKKVFLAAAAVGLALTSSAARATTIHFIFDTGAGITLDGTIDETGGVANSGSGTITGPFGPRSSPSCCCRRATRPVPASRIGSAMGRI
jgi:hypothetical protein